MRLDLFDLDQVPLTAKPYFSGGDPGPIVAALAQVPELLGPTLAFVGAALGPGAAGVRCKELAILRTSALQGCRYCVHAHTTVAVDAGLTPDEVRGLRGEIPLDDAFPDEAERTLLRWIDAMAGATGPISDAVWSPARRWWPDHLLVELATTIGATLFLNRFATGFELPTSPEVIDRLHDGGFPLDTSPVPPEGELVRD
jgi:AhpD family alkylhydroperoxidase